MRAPPTMQAALAGDVVLEHVARALGKDLDDIMQLNFYKEGDVTAQGDLLGSDTCNYTVPQLWRQIQQDAKYAERKQAVETFNANNRWTKKGIAITTSKWQGTANGYQNSAHVSIYDDGTVQVASGGVEIGQGLNTKVAMAAANVFGIPLEKVNVGQGDTAILPNNGTTGGSGTSEACAQAALYACQELLTKLQPYLDDAGGDFAMAVAAAKAAGENLVAIGWTVGEWDKRDESKNASTYLVYGACVSEVLLDVLTGDVRLEKVDVVMDLGNQLDAAVDIGQVQGGFVQALGYLFTEKMAWKEDGQNLNLGTWEYKVPSAYDIPLEFNVALLKDSPNPNGVKESKAVAEPAMHLIGSPYLAVKNAIYAARQEVGLGSDWFMLNSPICNQEVRAAIGVPQDQMLLPQ